MPPTDQARPSMPSGAHGVGSFATTSTRASAACRNSSSCRSAMARPPTFRNGFATPPSRLAGPPAMIAPRDLHWRTRVMARGRCPRGARRPARTAHDLVRAMRPFSPAPARSRRRTAARRGRSPARRRRCTIAAPRHQVPRVQRPLPVTIQPAARRRSRDRAPPIQAAASPAPPPSAPPTPPGCLHRVARVREPGHQQRRPQPVDAPTA